MTKLATALPKDPSRNGLDAIGADLLIDPLKRHIVLAVVDCSKITTTTSTGDCEATVRVLRIEQVHPDDIGEAERLIRRALEHRSGETVLPIDLEKDLEALFGKGVTVDTTTGVVTVPSDDGPDGPDDVDHELDLEDALEGVLEGIDEDDDDEDAPHIALGLRDDGDDDDAA